MTIGQRIRQTRGSVARKAFAGILKIHPQTLYLYEKDKRVPDTETLTTISRQFKISLEWLINGENAMHDESPAHSAEPQGTPVSPTDPADPCPRCAKLEAELQLERQERRELSIENRRLWCQISTLQARCATLEERQKQVDASPPTVSYNNAPLLDEILPKGGQRHPND